MLDYLLIIFLLCAGVLALIVGIPFFINLNHQLENNSNHIYNIFIDETGYKGFRLTSAVFVFLPISALSFPTMETQSYLILGLLWAWAMYTHSRLFIGINLWDAKLSMILAFVIFVHVILSIMEQNGYLSKTLSTPLSAILSLTWGYIATMKRAKLVKSSKDK